ncbi:SDR family NAD(P)-dependent oxidoreductase [Hamadaea tsunoensis]|uniref:SDR family NAD(P)-dependent oxidoreductase n=1 Tax=Hamadaea tsunoensis TaxID=53368 RepID=UPI0003FE29DE|nr:SDR family oxidoreductase [Hamadaea tsunoensis]
MTGGPVVVVTGAAAGIGRACVDLFAARGHRVVAVDVDRAGLDALAGRAGIVTLAGDTGEPATATAMVAAAVERFGRLDAAVLNAGIGGTRPLEADDAIDRFDEMWRVNVRGVALGLRAAVPALRAAGGGAVVVTASVAGLRADAGTWAYNATKAAAVNLVRAAALDYAHENIRINAIAPGLTRTRLTGGDPGPQLLRRIPLGRWATAAEQAEAVWFLASPAASFITGTVLPVDGGLHAGTGLLDPPAVATGGAADDR